ncbi:MAG: TonB-dependent receptor [Pseudomonadota bacterium]|nr:TonB-dependent receptor [Pseudomonadota bacterium]
MDAGVAVIAASSQYARGNENNMDPAGRIGGYAVWNLDSAWRPAPQWQVDVTLLNVLNRRYQTFATLASNLFRGDCGTFAPELARPEPFVGPAPPRAAWITVSYSFGRT